MLLPVTSNQQQPCFPQSNRRFPPSDNLNKTALLLPDKQTVLTVVARHSDQHQATVASCCPVELTNDTVVARRPTGNQPRTNTVIACHSRPKTSRSLKRDSLNTTALLLPYKPTVHTLSLQVSCPQKRLHNTNTTQLQKTS